MRPLGIVTLLITVALVQSSCGESQQASQRRQLAIANFGALQPREIDAGPPLRELALVANLEIGTAISGHEFHDPTWRNVVTREFTQATVNWGVYWPEVEPARSEFDFEVIDQQVRFAESKGFILRGHPLVFASSHPEWLNDSDYNDAELLEILRHHVTQIVSRYRGRIHQWVVVNEPYLRRYREVDVFYSRFRYDYILEAFAAARAADPDALLLFNDTDNHIPGSKTTEMNRGIVNRLRARSLIDGIGCQMHLMGDDPPDKQGVIDTFRSYGVPVYVTEFDVDMRNVEGTKSERFAIQALIYGDMLEACLESEVCVSFTVWGMNDKYSWAELKVGALNSDPLPFDEELRRKPAHTALARSLARWNARNDNQGR